MMETITWLQPEPKNWLEMKNSNVSSYFILWEHFIEAKVIGSAPNHFLLQYQPALVTDIYDNLWLSPKVGENKDIFAHSDDVFLLQDLIDSYSTCKNFRVNNQWFNRNQFCQHFGVKDNNIVKKVNHKNTVSTKTTSNNFNRYNLLINYNN